MRGPDQGSCLVPCRRPRPARHGKAARGRGAMALQTKASTPSGSASKHARQRGAPPIQSAAQHGDLDAGHRRRIGLEKPQDVAEDDGRPEIGGKAQQGLVDGRGSVRRRMAAAMMRSILPAEGRQARLVHEAEDPSGKVLVPAQVAGRQKGAGQRLDAGLRSQILVAAQPYGKVIGAAPNRRGPLHECRHVARACAVRRLAARHDTAPSADPFQIAGLRREGRVPTRLRLRAAPSIRHPGDVCGAAPAPSPPRVPGPPGTRGRRQLTKAPARARRRPPPADRRPRR